MNDQNIGECFVLSITFPLNMNSFRKFFINKKFVYNRYSPLSPADFFAAATATYLPAAAAAAASATTLTPATGKLIMIIFYNSI
jgi:hypothetical protein